MMPGDDYDDAAYDEDVEYYAIRPNKTQIKREMAELFHLAEDLSALTPVQLETIELPENLHKACLEVAAMPLTGARKRLLKFITGQLYKIDIQPVQEKLDRIKSKSIHAVREHHLSEQWRDRLLNEGDNALAELIDSFPTADRQKLRQLIRNACKEAETAKPPKSARLLYRYLKELIGEGENASNEIEPSIDLDEEI
jgi:ribosome-associated protein